MDFYYAMTNYHVLCCLIHKLVINKNKGTLYLSSFLQYNQPNIVNNIKESKIFEEVKFYDELEFKKTEKIMNKDEISNEIKRINNLVEKNIGKEIKAADNIYLCSDFYSIGVYVNNNNIKYSYFEDGCGILSRYYMPFKILEKENPNRAAIVKKQGAFGNNKNVINRFGSLKEQEEGYSNPKDIDFSVKDLLKKLSNSDINKILKIYEAKKINIKDKKAVLLLTMHYNELMNHDEQKNIYTSLIDYLSDENRKIVIKPHPADTIWDYDKIFKGSKVINRYMPAEIFPYCLNNKFEKGITCWSTSIYNLKDILKSIVNFDTRIDKTYKDFDKYYAVVEFLNTIKSEKKINIIFKEINEIQFEKLLEKYIKDYKKYFTFDENEINSIYITNKKDNSLINKKVISLEYDINSKNYIHIKRKTKEKEEDVFISIYNIDNINKLSVKKDLKYSNKTIIINNINEEEHKDILLNIVKKQNDNTEKKIKKYEDKIAKLEKEIQEKNKKLEGIYTSTSWKVTKPIRKMGDIIRKIKNN